MESRASRNVIKFQASAVAIQPDGKILAAGFSVSSSDFALARYNADGTLDPTFATAARCSPDFPRPSLDRRTLLNSASRAVLGLLAQIFDARTFKEMKRLVIGRSGPNIEARHLLSGFVLCGACGGSMHAIRRTIRPGAPRVYYVSNGWRVDGTCDNSWSLPLPDLDASVLSALREDVLTPHLVDGVVTRAVELAGAQHASLDSRRKGLEGELRRVERELERFAEAIASGASLPTLLEAMRARERRRADITAQLEHVDGLERSGRPVAKAELRATLRARLESWGRS